MGEQTITTLRLGGVPVGTYRDGRGLDPTLSPRPYLHPVRTLAGTPVTDALPADHPWHLGISVALQDVDGCNFWGGPTYVRGQGYVWRDDHGHIDHEVFRRVDDTGFAERLRWVTSAGELLLREHRSIEGRPADHGWELELTTTLTNASGRDLRIGSPATNGREGGAGYGGFFWRLPRAGEPWGRTQSATGESAGHGSLATWLAWSDPAAGFTLVFTRAERVGRADPWFVRIEDYPGVGLQLAAREPLGLPSGGRVSRGMRVLLSDGVLQEPAVLGWAEATARQSDGNSDRAHPTHEGGTMRTGKGAQQQTPRWKGEAWKNGPVQPG